MEVISKKRKVSEAIPESSPSMQKELIRLVIQALYDSGYRKAAEQLESESGIHFEAAEVTHFREGVLAGNWDLVSSLLSSFSIPQKSEQKLRLCVKEQKYLEQISDGSYREALDTLRNEVTPLHSDPKNLHHLASLLLCKSSEELKENSDLEYDRKKILCKVQGFIPPNIMIPSGRLLVLLNQALEYQINSCEKHCGFFKADTLLEDHSCERFSLPSKPEVTMTEASEVWDAVFSHNGELLAVICKTLNVAVWRLRPAEKLSMIDGEASGLAWTLDDKCITTGSINGAVTVWSIADSSVQYTLKDHTDKVTSCVWISSLQLLTGGVDRKLILWENKTKARQWDIRVRQIEKSQDNSVVAVLNASKSEVIIYGYSPLEKMNTINEDDSITSIQLSLSGSQVLTAVGLIQPKLHLWSISGSLLMNFEGFVQEKFILKPCFAGPNEDLVMIGSEDGKVHVWSKLHGTKLGELLGHNGSVNAVVQNPKMNSLVITAGDDGVVRIWNLIPGVL